MRISWLMLTVTLFMLTLTTTAPAAQAAGNYITGTVYTSSGQPAASLWVRIHRDSIEKGRSLSGDDGKYYIGDLEQGTYTLTVERQGWVLFTMTVRLSENRVVDITLP